MFILGIWWHNLFLIVIFNYSYFSHYFLSLFSGQNALNLEGGGGGGGGGNYSQNIAYFIIAVLLMNSFFF